MNFLVLQNPQPQEIPFPSVEGVWISGTAHSVEALNFVHRLPLEQYNYNFIINDCSSLSVSIYSLQNFLLFFCIKNWFMVECTWEFREHS